MDESSLRAALSQIDPRGRDLLRRYLIADQPERDALASRLLRERTPSAEVLADLVDWLTLNPEDRRRVTRLLGEIDAGCG